MRFRSTATLCASALGMLTATGRALADDAAAPTGKPPADQAALVAAPTAPADTPKFADAPPSDETTATLSAGGQLSTGNSQLAAATGKGDFAMRRGSDAFGASIIGNYGEGAPANQDLQVTTENLQGRLRYDRYLTNRFSAFLIGTGRHDRFQGLDFRLNVDPGVNYLFYVTDATKLWGELGYDFQYDVRRDDARVLPDGSLLPKTNVDHSSRVYVGYKHAFNKEVTLATGVEYLQSFVESTSYRINYDALFAANVGGGLALGLGFSARYDHNPLPGKNDLDTATTVSLIYSYSDLPAAAPPPPPPPAPCAPAPVAPPAGPATPIAPTTPAAPAPASTSTTTTQTTTAPGTTTTTTTTTTAAPATPTAPPPAPPH
jgi:putative salt-induced outer membrane protein